jgi:ribosome biogenesis GTPase A
MVSYNLMVKDVIKKADVLLEVVDARFPDETRNHDVERLVKRSGKPLIIVLNKCDLVSKEKLEASKSRLSKVAPAVFVSVKERFGTTMLRHKILEVANMRGENILVGSLGYPNTGKSSVINGVSGKAKASTSSISGHTKGVQMINAGSKIMFLDTPGVIPFGDNDEYLQGLLGVKDATHLSDPLGVAMKIIEKLCDENPSALEKFYDFEIGDLISEEIVAMIGLQCNFIKKKGQIDEGRAATRIINDWQKGILLI